MGKPEPLCAVLFDIDGTLIDTVDLIVQALDYTYRKHLGVALPRAELRRLIGLPLSVQMRYLDDRITGSAPHEQMEADEVAYYAANRHLERVIPEAVQAVQTAYRKGYAVGLVTSKNREELQLSLPKLQLDDFVDTIVSADDTERHKPNPDPVLMRYHKLVAQRKAAGLSWYKVGQAYARLFERVGRDVALPYGVVQPAVASYLESQRAG